MKLEDACSIDCTREGSMTMLQDALKSIKPIAKRSSGCDVVPLDIIEAFMFHMSKKYHISPQWINVDTGASDKTCIYFCTLVNDDTHERVCMVHGASMYELLAKVAIAIAVEVKKEGK